MAQEQISISVIYIYPINFNILKGVKERLMLGHIYPILSGPVDFKVCPNA